MTKDTYSGTINDRVLETAEAGLRDDGRNAGWAALEKIKHEIDESTPGDRWYDATVDLLVAHGMPALDAETAMLSLGRRLVEQPHDDFALAYGPDAVRVMAVIRGLLGHAAS